MKTPLFLLLISPFALAGLTSCEGGLFDLMSPADSVASVSGVWTAANSPYQISSSRKVYWGDSLIIEPGVEVIFESAAGLIIEGCLKVQGSETDCVRFTAKDPVQGWYGIRFGWTQGLNELNYAIVEYGHGDPAYGENGGGIACVYSPNLSLRHCTIRHCQTDFNGGGIYAAFSSSLQLDNCHISHCSAQDGGGLSLQYCNGALIDSCIFFDNFASGIYGGEFGGGGGGILCKYCNATFTRNLVYSNQSNTSGAGLFLVGDSTPVLRNNTVALNRILEMGANSIGAGVFAPEYNAQISGSNNIIYFNVGYENSQCSGPVNFTYSCSSDSLSGVGNMTANPQFADTAAADFALMAGSPCIDSGDPASSLDPDGTRADMGAIYFPH